MTNLLATALGETLRARIAATGPIALSHYMTACLSDPEHGYYQQQDPFGTDGDFITGPEISGMFGEICGLFLAHIYEVAKPVVPDISAAIVAELGPGRGTLMRDMQHAWTQPMPDLADRPVHLVETSQRLRDQQAATLGSISGLIPGSDQHVAGADLVWHDDASTLPNAPIFGIANEFFDALPQDQYIYRKGQWHHRLVGLDDASGGLCFVDGPPVADADADITPTEVSPNEGDIREICPAADIVIDQLAARIARFGGAVLIIDYGRRGADGDTLQAVADHRPVDPFFEPGRADLSHWVDFGALAARADAAGARLVGPVPQGRFLMRVGLGARAEQAAANADPEMRRTLLAAIDRLTSPAQMGEAFKVALLIPSGDGVPPGFETD